MTIYIDILIVENLIMNAIILYATGIIAKSKLSFLRIFLASLVGAIYVFLEYIIKINYNLKIILRILLSIIIIFIAFNPQTINKMWKELVLFYLTTFTFGGIATYLIYVLKPEKIVIKNGVFIGNYVLKVIFIGAILGTLILVISFKITKSKISKKDLKRKIKITLNNKSILLDALVDTGNMLKEPITGDSVIIVEKNALYTILPNDILKNIDKILGGDFNEISEEIKNEYMKKLKIIPFSSLGKQNGMLIGIKPQKVEIIDEQIETKNNAIIGIYNKSLTKRGEYNAIIGPELL